MSNAQPGVHTTGSPSVPGSVNPPTPDILRNVLKPVLPAQRTSITANTLDVRHSPAPLSPTGEYLGRKRKQYKEAYETTKDPGWVDFAIRLISDAEAAEKRNQAHLNELAAAVTKLDDTLRSLSLHTPFINATRTVDQLLEDNKEDTAGVDEVTKAMRDAMDRL